MGEHTNKQSDGLNTGATSMSTKPEIDPYYQWLGIPPAEQPPNHYRLLGLTLFESSVEAIDSASFRQTLHLRTYAVGPHSDHSQKLLNEVAAAKICLTKPDKKAAYDAELRTKLAPAETPPRAPVIKPPVPPPLRTVRVPEPTPVYTPPASPRPRRQTQRMADLPPLPSISRSQMLPMLRPHSKSWPWQWITVGGGAAVLVLGLALFVGLYPSDESPTKIVPEQSDPIQAFKTSGIAEEQANHLVPTTIPPWPTPRNAPPAPAPALSPFSADQAKQHQEAWAAFLGIPVVRANSIGLKLALIPPGVFPMGSPDSDFDRDDDEQQHTVRITKPFYLGVYEVTQLEFEHVMAANPSHFSPQGGGHTGCQ